MSGNGINLKIQPWALDDFHAWFLVFIFWKNEQFSSITSVMTPFSWDEVKMEKQGQKKVLEKWEILLRPSFQVMIENMEEN